jgi:hypothetical protein
MACGRNKIWSMTFGLWSIVFLYVCGVYGAFARVAIAFTQFIGVPYNGR